MRHPGNSHLRLVDLDLAYGAGRSTDINIVTNGKTTKVEVRHKVRLNRIAKRAEAGNLIGVRDTCSVQLDYIAGRENALVQVAVVFKLKCVDPVPTNQLCGGRYQREVAIDLRLQSQLRRCAAGIYIRRFERGIREAAIKHIGLCHRR